jgi:hypothetical protein
MSSPNNKYPIKTFTSVLINGFVMEEKVPKTRIN